MPQRPEIVRTAVPGEHAGRLSRAEQIEIVEQVYRRVQGGQSITQAVRAIARKRRRSEQSVWRILPLWRDTTRAAESYLKAKSLMMAERVVEKANVDQMVDILSRPNIDVLKPIQRVQADRGGIQISVSAVSCGAVKEGSGVIDVSTSQPLLEEGEDDAEVG